MIQLFKSLGKRLRKIGPERPKDVRDEYPQYDIGRHTYGLPLIVSWDEGTTCRIGSFCSIASGVMIFLGGEHRVDWATTYPFNVLWEVAGHLTGHPGSKGNVDIGNDVWIGTEALIMSGVTIGDGAVVGARSVVTKDIEPYAIYAGNPARLVRKRFGEETIRQLLEIKWWDFRDEDIEKLLPFMLDTDIGRFIDRVAGIRKQGAAGR